MKDLLLTQLRQTLRQEAAKSAFMPKKSASPAIPKNTEPEVDEAVLFDQAMRGVKRISSDNPSVPPPSTRSPQKPLDANTIRRRLAATAEDAPDSPISDTQALQHLVSPEESLSYAGNGISLQKLQELKRGQPAWQAAIDLHGCTVDQAREAVLKLIQEAQQEALQVVKIVHGKGAIKGQALLKTYVNGWLRQLPEVLAFVSSLPRDGGTGALYVLLKRQRTTE